MMISFYFITFLFLNMITTYLHNIIFIIMSRGLINTEYAQVKINYRMTTQNLLDIQDRTNKGV